MRKCKECKTVKKADNCTQCALKYKRILKAIKEHLINILEMPKKDYKKIEMIENLIFKESLFKED